MNQERNSELPLITVATVTYNAETTLGRTLESVQRQIYPRVEHLIIDGCSSDGTLGLVQRYVEQNSNAEVPHSIRLVQERDEGIYDAMNKALQQATGDYIVFLNAGDKFCNERTLSIVAKCACWHKGSPKNPAVVYGQTNIVDDDGNVAGKREHSAPEKLTSRSFLLGMLVCHQSFYVRTDLAREEAYNLRYHYSADYDWCIRVMKRAERRRLSFVNTHTALTDYLKEGTTTKNHRKSLKERLRIMAHHYSWPAAICMHGWFVVRTILRK